MRTIKVLLVAVLVVCSVGVATAGGEEHFDNYYLGASLGNAVHTASLTDIDYDWFGGTIDLKDSGVIFGLQFGRNWQSGASVFGVELDYNSADVDQMHRYSDSVDIDFELKSVGSLRFRGGLAVERTLLFATTGVAFGDFDGSWIEDFDPTDSWPDLGDSSTGWMYGVGIEHMNSNGKFSFKLEATHSVFGDYEVTNEDDYTFIVDNDVFLIRAGFNYHF